METFFVRQFYVFATLVSWKQSKTTISLNFRSTVLRFCNIKTIFVRQFYVFATLVSGKQNKTTISRNHHSTVPRFCNIKTIFVRQFHVFATLMSGKHCKTTISLNFRRQFKVLATSRRFSFDSSTVLYHWCPENKAKQRCEGQNVWQFYVFATKIAPRRFLSDNSIFWTKKNENTVFSHVFTICFSSKPCWNTKERKKNAAFAAPGKRNTISRHL